MKWRPTVLQIPKAESLREVREEVAQSPRPSTHTPSTLPLDHQALLPYYTLWHNQNPSITVIKFLVNYRTALWN
jgi:hypothetical protein